MKFSSSAVLAASLAASSAWAGLVTTTTLTASGIAGTGGYLNAPNSWTIDFTFTCDLDQSGMNADFGSWEVLLTNTDGSTWTTSSTEVSNGTWKRDNDARILRIELAQDDAGIGTGTVNPTPKVVEVIYTVRRSGAAWESLGSALEYSAAVTTPANRRGALRVAFDDISEIKGAFAIPAPGAAALIGLAGLIVSRRRNP